VSVADPTPADPPTGPDPGPRATRREWTGLAVIALPCLVYAMDLTVLNLALPAISVDLSPTSAQLLWMVDIYGFFVAGFLITMGTLGDRYGRRLLLMIGAAAFAAASIAAALSTSASMLVAMRALLGVAGATLAPSTMSLIRNMFRHDDERRFAIGVWIASFSLGGVVGPLVGGVMLQWFGWGSVFLVAVPVMALLLVLGPWLLPEYRDPKAGRIDAASVALSLGASLCTIWGLKQIAESGIAAGPAAVLVAGLALGWVFVRRQARLDYPLLDLALFARPAFAGAIAAYGLSCLAMFGTYLFIGQYLQLVLGLSPLQAGLATVPWSLGFVAGSLLAPRLARAVPPSTVLVGGLALASVGFGLLALVDGPQGLAMLVAGTVVMSLGLAPVFTVCNELIITSAPPERAGSASALSETASEFCGALGIAVFGSLGMVVYRRTLGGSLPDALSADAVEASVATLGGAVAAAGGLDGPLGASLLAASRSAFVDALQASAVAAVAVMVATTAIAARLLRPPRVAYDPRAGSGPA
jgi:DHA2 family multidrug resistance protein-like MFS transporter